MDDQGHRAPLLAHRREQILELVQRPGGAAVAELAERLGVSPATVRRDLQWLAQRQLLARTWGGGVANGGRLRQRSTDLELAAREVEAHDEKQRIAAMAASLVGAADTIAVDAGSTTELMAPFLATLPRVTVVTSSLPLAWALRHAPSVDLFVVGGHVYQRAGSMVGMLAERVLEQLYVDIAFIGARGLTVTEGLTNPVLEEVPIKRLMIRNAQKRIAVVDSAKWGRAFMGHIAPITAFDIIVTDAAVPEELRAEVEKAGPRVSIAR